MRMNNGTMTLRPASLTVILKHIRYIHAHFNFCVHEYLYTVATSSRDRMDIGLEPKARKIMILRPT